MVQIVQKSKSPNDTSLKESLTSGNKKNGKESPWY